MEEDKEILYFLDIAINSYIENDILRLDVSDTTKNRLKRDLRKKFRDEDFIYDIKNNIGLIPKSKVKEKIEELDNERRKFTNDNVNNFYLQEFTRKYTQKSDHDYGIFGTPETITYCINNELLGRIEVLQELLREE